MSNLDVAKEWVKKVLDIKEFDDRDYDEIYIIGNHMSARGRKLYSYSTPICIYRDKEFIYSRKKYSKTTSKHQSCMRQAISCASLRDPEIRITTVEDINDEK